jgi:Flagellar hook-length control protein FliK
MNVMVPLAVIPALPSVLAAAPSQPEKTFDLVLQMLPECSDEQAPLPERKIAVEAQGPAFAAYLQNISPEFVNPENGLGKDVSDLDIEEDDLEQIKDGSTGIFNAQIPVPNIIETHASLIATGVTDEPIAKETDIPQRISGFPMEADIGLNDESDNTKTDIGISKIIANFASDRPKSPPSVQDSDGAKLLPSPQVISSAQQGSLIDPTSSNTDISNQRVAITPSPSIDKLSIIDPVPLTERYLDLARDSLWLDSLTRDIVAAGMDQDRLSFRLRPENLGRLDVDLAHVDGDLSVQITASTDDAAKIVAAAQPRLFEELRAQGIRVSGGDVASSNHQQSRQSFPGRHAEPIEHPASSYEDNDQSQTTRPTGRFA